MVNSYGFHGVIIHIKVHYEIYIHVNFIVHFMEYSCHIHPLYGSSFMVNSYGFHWVIIHIKVMVFSWSIHDIFIRCMVVVS